MRSPRATVAIAATLSGATMVPAIFVMASLDGRGLDTAFVACWVALLSLSVPLLHRDDGAHGTRALGWLALAPVIAFSSLVACGHPQTSPWGFVCGTPAGGLVISPLLVPWIVVPVGAVARHLVDRLGPYRLRASIVLCGAAIALALVTLATSTYGGPSPRERLRREVHMLAPLPEVEVLEGERIVHGAHVKRVCSRGRSCVLQIDGLEAHVLDARADGPLELAEGLGYRFVRRAGSDPHTWLAYRPGDAYGTEIDARHLVGRVAPVHGLGAALALVSLIAAAYLALAVRRLRDAWRIARGGVASVVAPGLVEVRGVVAACDPTLATGAAIVLGRVEDGGYRALGRLRGAVVSGERDALLERAREAATQHLFLTGVILVLATIPPLVVARCGLALAL